MDSQMNISEHLGFRDTMSSGHGPLRGRVSIYVQDTKTKEISLWDEDDNIIPISGYQFILLKIFGLTLDSLRNVEFEDPGMDTNLVIPDLNYDGKPTLGIGVNPKDYTRMNSDNADNHYVQGFMVGNGGSGEDNISTKNTDYSYVNLRNPIPFRQTQTRLTSDIANNYMGELRLGKGSFTKSYYIKRFSKRPGVIHSWWKDGQKWDFKDPVQRGDLGPHSANPHRNNRIETYVDINFSIEEDDCIAYFNHEGSTQAALLNELGLVAFDVLAGDRSILVRTYERLIRKLIELIMDNNRVFRCPECDAIIGELPTPEHQLVVSKYVRMLAMQIKQVFDNIRNFPGTNSNMKDFVNMIDEIVASERAINETRIPRESIIILSNGYEVGDELKVRLEDGTVIFLNVSKVNADGGVTELVLQNPTALNGFNQPTHLFKPIRIDEEWPEEQDPDDPSITVIEDSTALHIKLVTELKNIGMETSLEWTDLQKRLTEETNIFVEAFYNNDGSFVYFQDKFLTYLADACFTDLSTDEAQRIKLMTYYTFKAIPLESNRRILINYRVYAN